MDNIDKKLYTIFGEMQDIIRREIKCEDDKDIVIAFKSSIFLLNYIVKNKFTIEEIKLLRDELKNSYKEFKAEYYG